jgi:hypothetical protein
MYSALVFSQGDAKSLFKELPSSQTKIDFSNTLNLDLKVMAKFDYNYAGGGVAVGDINNDGLIDIYIVGNSVADKLYLNKGDFVFEDITKAAILSGFDGWHTGVNMVDVNADGYLDIFVSRLNKDLTGLTNLLYINNKDNTFSESSEKFGFVDTSITFQTVFFDGDLDGDLDCYVLNSVNREKQTNSSSDEKQFSQSDIYYENKNGFFINESKKVGINNNSFGLSAVASDVDNDGQVDLYVSNDFEGRDYLFMNENGVFNEDIMNKTKHISYYGMGVDVADINNDGLVDVIVLDMGYDDHVKSKENMPTMSFERFWKNVYDGNHYQYMQNTLQLNNGNGTFSEIAQLAGISKTDWSWGVLLADFDNDGYKDIVITNGIKREIMNQDFRLTHENQNEIDTSFFKTLPLSKSQNRFYKNNKDLTFSNVSQQWGVNSEINSSGVAYADFDNDGDLDLVVNNLDTICSIFENQNSENNNYLSFQLKGNSDNPFAIGARITIYSNLGMQMKELFPVRGFQSSVDYRLLFGLDKDEVIEKVVIRWPDLKTTVLKNIKVNQFLIIDYNKSKFKDLKSSARKEILFSDYTEQLNLNYEHNENKFNDFDRELLLPHMYSRLGPTISVGDINGDGLEDFFVGSPKNQKSIIYIQDYNGAFSILKNEDIENDFLCEDVGSLFFDFDNDNDLDLFVASGGNDLDLHDTLLQDRLYINDGRGHFIKSSGVLPVMLTSTKIVKPYDFDNDGDIDLFVGGRIVPGYFPQSPKSYLLKNENGKMVDVTLNMCPDIQNVGMVTGANFEDVNGDELIDLVLVGEWMPLSVFINKGNKLELQTPKIETEGLWYSLEAVDVDNDGDIDFVAGNLGMNTKYKASEKKPFHVYGNDFDNNGQYDIVLSTYQDTINYPVRGKECSSQQMPFINDQFKTYHDYAIATMEDIYGDKLNESKHLTVRTLKSCVFMNDGSGNFTMQTLPNEAQFSPIQSILIDDYNKDGNMDVLMVGNMYETEVETVRYDAGIGVCLLGDGKGGFSVISNFKSGFFVNENVKTLKKIMINHQNVFLIGVNNRFLRAFILN